MFFWQIFFALLGTGSNKYGQLALPVPRAECFEVIPLPHPCTSAACGTNHTLVLCAVTSTTTAAFSGDAAPDATQQQIESVLYGFGSNNNQQITATSTATMFRTPTPLTTIATGFGANQMILVAAGGDQSFAVAVKNPAVMTVNEFSAGAYPHAGGLLRKQFSTIASKATIAISAKALLNLVSRAKGGNNSLTEGLPAAPPASSFTTGAGLKGPPLKAQQEQALLIALNTTSEIFSSPSLLAGSFECAKDSAQAQHQRAVMDAAVERLQWEVILKQQPEEYPTLQTFAVNPTFDWNKVSEALCTNYDLQEYFSLYIRLKFYLVLYRCTPASLRQLPAS